jgi:hypothetical protein
MLEEILNPTAPTIHPGLPGRDYHAPEVFELEKERIFFRSWFCVGREEQLAEPGDFLTARVAGESVILTRDRARRHACVRERLPSPGNEAAGAALRPPEERGDRLSVSRLDVRGRRPADRHPERPS